MKDWPDIRKWRQEKRRELLERRGSLSPAARKAALDRVVDRLMDTFPVLMQATLGFYWPFKGELNLRSFVGECIEIGAQAALPVVVEKSRPLEFWRWTPEMPLKTGIWDIPVPASRDCLEPSVLLVPLVGYDENGYRLGHGGGYYDRTLAAMKQRPLVIGVGYAFQQLATIHPQPHDIPMDHIVTEEVHFARTTGTDAASERVSGGVRNP